MTPSNVVGLSCISVGTGAGGTISMLARVSVIDFRGYTTYDTFVRPTGLVESYRTATTGLKASDFEDAPYFQDVQKIVAGLLHGKIIVGYQLWHDLQVLGLSHPTVCTRDMALFLPFRATLQQPEQIIGLPTLVWQFLRRKVTAGYLDSVENARATMDLYRSHSAEWEDIIKADQWPCALPPQSFSRCYT